MRFTTTFREIPRSASLQAAAERWVSRLEQVCDQIVACQVTIERLPRHYLAGSLQIHIWVSMLNDSLQLSHQTDKDVYVALADAFRAARSRLLEHVAHQHELIQAPAGGVSVRFASKL